MNITLWSVQTFLVLFFLAAAIPKITGRGLEQWVGFSNVPRALVIAIGLSINVLMATGFHVRPMND